MATLNRTFSVKNGIDVANTIIVDASRNLSNIVTANATTVNATTFVTSAGLNVTDQANNAYGQANAAYDKANSGFGQANAAYGQANAAYGQANAAYGAANNAANTVRVSANGGSTLSQKQLNFVSSPSIEVAVIDAGNGNANIVFNTTGAAVADAYAQANAAYGQANAAYGQANTARDTANGAYAQANSDYQPAVTELAVTNNGTTAYRFDQYGTVDDPEIYIRAGETIAFNLNNAGHPFVIRVSNGGANYNTGLTHVATDGNVSTGSSAQGKVSGKLYWKVPYELLGNTYVYQCTAHSGMVGNIVIEPPGTFVYAQANAAYGQANAAYTQANTARTTANDAYLQANTARDTANGAYAQANGAYAQANGAYAQANGAYAQANGAYSQANGAFAQANGAYAQANGAYGIANLKIASITVSGNGLAVTNTTTANVNDYTLSVNTASTTQRGTTLLIDSVSSTDTANAATANAVKWAYEYANGKLSLTGGVVVGDVTIDGNLFVNGVQTIVNTNSLTVNDPIFLLANNNTTNSVGIGIVGHYGPTQQHSGLVRAHQDNIWYLFEDYDDHILYANNVLDTGNIKLATLKANISANSILLVGNIVATQANLTIAHNQANAAYAQANAAYADANTRVLKAGDTMTGGLTITTSGIGLRVANANVTYSLQVGTLNVTTNTVTTSSSGQVVLDKFPATQLASAKYFIQANSSTDYHTTEMVLVQDATNVWITEYGSIQTGPSLGSFSADISSGDVRLLFNATNNVNTIRAVRYGIIP